MAAPVFEDKVLDKLDELNAKISSLEKTLIKFEGELSHHVKREEEREGLTAVLERRIQALEALQEQAKGAAMMVRILWALGGVLLVAAGWVAKHLSLKP